MDRYRSAEVDELVRDIRNTSARVVVYGANALLTEATLHALRLRGIEPCCLADGRRDLVGGMHHGLPVISAEELADSCRDAYVFICLTREFWTVFDLLAERGMNQVHDVGGLLADLELCDSMFGQSGQFLALSIASHQRLVEVRSGYLSLPFVNTIVTEHCSLNCRDCNNLVPLIRDKRVYARESLLEQVARLLTGLDSIVMGSVIGGEPFLYPDLPEMLTGLAGFAKIENLGIVTNGTLLLQPRVVEALVRSRTHVIISNYGSLSPRIDELTALLSAAGIPHDVAAFNDWYDLGDLTCRRRTGEELKATFHTCKFKYCPTLLNGVLYRCSRSAFGTRVGAIPVQVEECIDLNDETLRPEEIRQRVWDLFYWRDSLLACNYCDGGNVVESTISPAIQD